MYVVRQLTGTTLVEIGLSAAGTKHGARLHQQYRSDAVRR
jgi:hypothetical protein